MKKIFNSNVETIKTSMISKPEVKIGRKYITTLERKIPIGFGVAENSDKQLRVILNSEAGIWEYHVEYKKKFNNYYLPKKENVITLEKISELADSLNMEVKVKEISIYSVTLAKRELIKK